jgi:hypothetical protein
MAMLGLLVLTSLVLGFSVLSSTEPTIAANQLRVAQARSVAEAGLERAAWALTHPAEADGLADPLPSPAPAPYDGSQLLNVTVNGAVIGGFHVAVTAGAGPTERNVTSTGWVPNNTAAGKAKQRITATLVKLRFPDPPAALAVRGVLEMKGSVDIDARADTSCGKKAGTWTTQTTSFSGAVNVWGADENNNENESTDIIQDVPVDTFDQYVLTDAEIDALRSYAKSHGTYYQGTVAFNASNKMPNGLIFVDTVSGQNITAEGVSPATPDEDMANVEIHGNAAADPSGIFKGWLFVNGTLQISGNFEMYGFMYAQNDMTYTGTGNGQVWGAAMTRNIRDTSFTSVDANLGGNAFITYDCQKAKTGGGFIPQTWTIKSGSYREISG